jgi:hypothetical protein
MSAVDESSTYCERTDLIREFCAHCRVPDLYAESLKVEKAQREKVRGPRLLGPWFIASHPGRCSRCNTPFRGGDEIRADWPEGAGYIAKACHPNARARRDAA